MTTFNELYKEMGELLSKYPEIGELEMCACGVDSRLNVFRQEPDGPVTGVSLEDASYMEGHISYAHDLVKSLGASLSSQHMEYLIQMCMEESSNKEMKDFIRQYSLSKKPNRPLKEKICVAKEKEGKLMDTNKVVELFRKKTDECFHNIEDFDFYTPRRIEEIVKKHIENIIDEADIDVEIIDVIITGSRCRGIEREDSDLDVVVEYKSDYWREDSLFNLLNEEEYCIEGIKVDINPITEHKSGTLEEYLPNAEKYLMEKEKILNEGLLNAAKQLDIIFNCSPVWTGLSVSLPTAYANYLSSHELRRLEEILEKQFLEKKVPQHKHSLSEQILNADVKRDVTNNKSVLVVVHENIR